MISRVRYSETVTQYAESVLAGDVVAGQPVRQACQRFLDDLDAQRADDFPFYFDSSRVDFACSFFPIALQHSTGEWAGQMFQLSDWQRFIVANLFGWIRVADDTRRFRKGHISVARKNGKSTLIAGVTLLLALEGEPDPQIYLSATKIDQAAIVFRMVEQMVRRSPRLQSVTELRRNNISFPRSGGFIRPLGSDKPFDGLNPSGCVYDELHSFKEHHRPFYDTLTTASAARRQPMQLTITTAGSDRSQLWNEETDYCRLVLDGTAVDHSLFCYIAELDEDDDPFDESTWIKANPNLGLSVKLDYLRSQAREALSKPQALNRFIRYHANRKVSSTETPLTPETWDTLAGELSDWKTADTIAAGIDVGGRNDLGAFAIAARFRAGDKVSDSGESVPLWRYECRVRSFVCLDGPRDLTQQPFAQWIHDENLIACRYVIAEMKHRLLADCFEHGISKIAFDPFNMHQLGDELEAEGLTPARMPQNHGQYNEPTLEFLDCVREGRIRHDGLDPVLRWSIGNFVLSRDSSDKVMPCRKGSADKIDPAISLIMAIRMLMFEPARSAGSLFIA